MNISMSRQSNPEYESMFDNLMQEVYGFSFAPWLERKLWDERYESYSFIKDGTMLSNVSIYKTDILIRGQLFRTHQIGAVATLESERGKSLSRMLIEHVLSLYPDTPAFLYAGQKVINFYPRFGFYRRRTYCPIITAAINNLPEKAVKYLPDDDFVHEMIYGERKYSNIVDSKNMQPIQMYHMLMYYTNNIYYLSDCEALVIAKQKDNQLFLADVVTKKSITFDKLIKELPFAGIDNVRFGFCPDWLDITPQWELTDWDVNPVFFIGDWNLPDVFRFPAMSAT